MLTNSVHNVTPESRRRAISIKINNVNVFGKKKKKQGKPPS